MSNFLTEHLIHRDDDFMVIHKPAGLLTVPGKTEDLQDCLINRLVKLEPKTLLIHRLDRDTSGILAFGLTKWGQKTISRQFQERQTITHWQAIEHFNIQGQPVTRVKLIPITGRSHQLRVHMQYLGHPIIGDTLYATLEQQQLSSRLCLHAERLSFYHPQTEQLVEFYCPAPF